MTVNNAENSSPLLSEEEYIIGDFSPLDQVSAIVIAMSYVGSKSEGVEIAKGKTHGKGIEVCIYKVYIVYSYRMCEKFQGRKFCSCISLKLICKILSCLQCHISHK